MKIIVIGLGSMGKRRIRLIREMYPDYEVLGIDGREDRRKEAVDLLKISCFTSTAEVSVQVDCAFICTSPLSHASIITDCLNRGWHVFTELNLVTDVYEQNIALAKEKDCVLFLSSSFLYREEIKYIRSRINSEKKWNYIYHIGQYLPDWHPWESYKDFFAGDKRTNGCREILAIELPWITRTFGNVETITVLSDKMSDLNICFEDNFMIQLKHKNGNKGTLIVDVVSPVAVRKLEAYAEHSYLSWNGTPDSIMEYNTKKGSLEEVILTEKTEHKEGYSTFIVENMYKNEIREFFDVVLNGKEPQYSFEQDQEILEMIDSMGA